MSDLVNALLQRRPVVLVETPWRGMRETKFPLGGGPKAQHYLRQAMRDALSLNEVPLASHALYAWTRVLWDEDPEQREEGINAALRLIELCDYVAAYVDFGISKGMAKAIWYAHTCGKKVHTRRIMQHAGVADYGMSTRI